MNSQGEAIRDCPRRWKSMCKRTSFTPSSSHGHGGHVPPLLGRGSLFFPFPPRDFGLRWVDNDEEFPSPPWHEVLLRETEQRLAAGEEVLMDWEKAKTLLREA